MRFAWVHQLTADDYSVCIHFRLNFGLVWFGLSGFFSSIMYVCMWVYLFAHFCVSIHSFSRMAFFSFSALAKAQVNARKLNENIKFGCITNKANLRIYQVYGHKIWLSKEWDLPSGALDFKRRRKKNSESVETWIKCEREKYRNKKK